MKIFAAFNENVKPISFKSGPPHFACLAGFSMLVTAFGMCAIPFCKEALLLTGLMSSIGMSMGVLDTGKSALGST